MRRLSQALLALLFACSVHAEARGKRGTSQFLSHRPVADLSVGPGRCFGPLDGASQPQSASEVVVWVNEDGDTIRTETNRVTATPMLQENVSR